VKTLSISSLSLVSLLVLAACSPESTTMVVTPPIPVQAKPAGSTVARQQQGWLTEDGGQSQMEFNPQLDILFVIDNSDSMRAAEANLFSSIDRFAAGFMTKNPIIDYHIGVISTWDSSERFAKNKKDPYQIGELRLVKDGNEQTNNKRFLTRADNKSLLASTLKIGVASYADGGPETEEFFSPVSAALDKSGHGAVNDGFFRDDSQLVVVFLTDADDASSQLTPEQMKKKLVDFKGGRADKVSVYGALVRKSDSDSLKDWDLRRVKRYHPECFDSKNPPEGCRTGFGPDRMEALISLSNSEPGSPSEILKNHTMSIVSKNFGNDLASIGANITEKTLAKVIPLSQLPAIDKKTGAPLIQVRYGTPDQLAQQKGTVIPSSKKGGWLYDSENNTLHLSGDIRAYEDAAPGSRFAIDLVPVTIAQ
jgi:hypothetical protein